MSNKYLSLIHKLLPSGLAWNKSRTSNLTKLCDGLSQEFARIDGRITGLLAELNPTKTNALISSYEKMMGLPEDAFGKPSTLQERRGLIVLKMALRGGQNKAFYIKLLKSLGFDIEIVEYRPFRAGMSRAGDAINNAFGWRHTFKVVMKQAIVYSFRAGQSAAGEPLRSVRNDVVHGVINKYKPAHTDVIFSFVD